MAKPEKEILTVEGKEVSISNPNKVLFPDAGCTKLDVVRYYLAVADGALRAAGGRPNVLVRYPNGIHGEFFYQKRAAASRGTTSSAVRPEGKAIVHTSIHGGREAGARFW